jgi:hypothetical protein
MLTAAFVSATRRLARRHFERRLRPALQAELLLPRRESKRLI